MPCPRFSLAVASLALLLPGAAVADPPVAAPGGFVPQHAVAFGAAGATATGVDAAHPLPITCVAGCSGSSGVTATIDQSSDGASNLVAVRSAPPATAATASIASGAALTGAVDLGAQRLHRIVIPAAWTAAAISFQSSADGTTFADLYDVNGEVVLPVASVGASRAVIVDPAAFLGIRYLKLRSGTGASPVNQAAQRDLTLVTVAR